MADPSDSIVEDLARRERLVAALMSQHPQTSTEQTLDEGVQTPKSGPEIEVGNILRCEVSVGKEEGYG